MQGGIVDQQQQLDMPAGRRNAYPGGDIVDYDRYFCLEINAQFSEAEAMGSYGPIKLPEPP